MNHGNVRLVVACAAFAYATFAWGLYARSVAPEACAGVLTPECFQAVLAAP